MIRSLFAVCAAVCCLSFASARMTKLERASEKVHSRSLRTEGPITKFCDSPVSKAEVKFPDSLIGRANHDFGMYSGYVPVTDEDWLFYWFFETQDGNADAPLVFWTNGGPGCTAMEGATTEIGPLVLFDIKESCSSSKCDYTGQLSTNAYGWNNHANVIAVDQPRNVGYSFGYGDGVHSSVEAGNDFVTFVNAWLELFPEYSNRAVYIAGESYGGHYLPAFANAIMDYNEQATTKINLAGLAIGNGCVNDTVQDYDDYEDFLHSANLIPADSHPKNEGAAYTAMVRNIGYVPNYYDYRLQSVTCSACYGYNYTAWSYWFLQDEVEEALNVCGDAGVDAFAGSAGGCISVAPFDSHDTFDYSGALGRVLNAGLPVVLYYGKQDTACNYVGGLDMANTISWQGTTQFASQDVQPLYINGAHAGEYKSYGPLTWLQVEGAGHMVPLDQPAAAALAIQTLLSQ